MFATDPSCWRYSWELFLIPEVDLFKVCSKVIQYTQAQQHCIFNYYPLYCKLTLNNKMYKKFSGVAALLIRVSFSHCRREEDLCVLTVAAPKYNRSFKIIELIQ